MTSQIITFQTFENMTLDQKWNLIDSSAKIVRPSDTLKTCKPNYTCGLYCSCPMPHYSRDKGDGKGSWYILLDNDNIFNGKMSDIDEMDQVEMCWTGYTIQLYDGILKMCPLNPKTSILKGVCNGVSFKFIGTTLEYGCWPGFLELYQV